MDRAEHGTLDADSRPPDGLEIRVPHRSDLEHYTRIQAAFSTALATWQQHWPVINAESLAALASHGIAISFRQSACGGYVATLLHSGGGGIDSGLCPSLLEARQLVLGHGREEGA